MNKFLILTLIVLVGGFSLNACKLPPTEEMNKAADAVARAENDNDAVNYAGATLSQARESLDKMYAESESKRFESAKNLANEVMTLAEKALADGKAAAARAKDEASRLIDTIGTELTQTENDLGAAANADLDLDVDALSNDLASAKNGLDDAIQHLNDENYQDAISNAEPVRPALADIRSTINDAATDASRKK